MSTHKHDHCEHNLKHCSKCDIVYCSKCEREWGQHHTWTYPNTWIHPKYVQPLVTWKTTETASDSGEVTPTQPFEPWKASVPNMTITTVPDCNHL